MSKEAFTIFVPVYNEKDSLARLEKALADYCLSRQDERDTFVLFVNDGSTDGSKEALEGICTRHPNFSVLSLDTNHGYSTAFKAAIDNCKTPLLGLLDADLQTTPEDFDTLLPYVEQYPLVTGSRVDRHDKWVKRLSSATARKVRQHFTHDSFFDITCPLKVMRLEQARQMPFFNGFHRFIPVFFEMMGAPVKVIPIRHFSRMEGKSKYGVFNRLRSGVIADCFGVRWIMKRHINYRTK